MPPNSPFHHSVVPPPGAGAAVQILQLGRPGPAVRGVPSDALRRGSLGEIPVWQELPVFV
jgi:hypothetical protein